MIKELSLINFRPFSNLELTFNNSLVILCGKNGIGKTSILEGMHLASSTKSFKDNNISNLIKKDTEYSKVILKADKEYSVFLTKDNHIFSINQKEYKRLKDYIGNLVTIIFSSTDLNLIDGTNLFKRRFLDSEISTINKNYLKTYSEYKKILSERNEALKAQTVDKTYLSVLTSELVSKLKYLYQERLAFIEKLNYELIDISKNLNFNKISIKYVKTYDDKNILKSFNDKMEYDIKTKTTNIGIHRDEFKVLIDADDAEIFASLGQKRMIAIEIKLALKEVIKRILGIDAILLLDDVFATLDNSKIEKLIEYIKDSKQVFITTTSVFEIPEELLKNASVIRIGEMK